VTKIRKIALNYLAFLGIYSFISLLTAPLLFSFSDDGWFEKIWSTVIIGPLELSKPFLVKFLANSIFWFLVVIGIINGIELLRGKKNKGDN
jgi:hypothetical protein